MDTLKPFGRVSRSFGPGSEVVISLYNPADGETVTKEPLFAKIDSLVVPLFFDSFQPHGASGALVAFADFDTPARAGELVGLELYTSAGSQSAGEVGHAMEDLVGYKALLAPGVEGQITAFLHHKMNPLLAVDIAGSEVLVPAMDEFIEKVSARKKIVTFSLPEGYIETFKQ